jgi:hypothetical protein
MATGWWSYVERIGNYAQQKDIAERAGIDAAALSRWKTELTRRPRAEHVVKFAINQYGDGAGTTYYEPGCNSGRDADLLMAGAAVEYLRGNLDDATLMPYSGTGITQSQSQAKGFASVFKSYVIAKSTTTSLTNFAGSPVTGLVWQKGAYTYLANENDFGTDTDPSYPPVTCTPANAVPPKTNVALATFTSGSSTVTVPSTAGIVVNARVFNADGSTTGVPDNGSISTQGYFVGAILSSTTFRMDKTLDRGATKIPGTANWTGTKNINFSVRVWNSSADVGEDNGHLGTVFFFVMMSTRATNGVAGISNDITTTFMQQYANQVAYGVGNKDTSYPRFANFQSGHNGWYRAGYGPLVIDGYEPWESGTYGAVQGQFWFALFNDDIYTYAQRWKQIWEATSGADYAWRRANLSPGGGRWSGCTRYDVTLNLATTNIVNQMFYASIVPGPGGGSTPTTTTTTTIPPSGEHLYSTTPPTPPSTLALGPGYPVVTGQRINISCSGTIPGIWWYRTAADTGTLTASLWTTGGSLLATAAGDPAAGPGYRFIAFSSPVSVSAGTTVIASIWHPNGAYGYDNTEAGAGHGFDGRSVTSPSTCLTSPATSAPAPNGVYAWTSSTATFPSLTYASSEYFVSPGFLAGAVSTTTTSTTTTTAPPSTTGLLFRDDFDTNPVFSNNAPDESSGTHQAWRQNDIWQDSRLGFIDLTGNHGSWNANRYETLDVAGGGTQVLDPFSVAGGVLTIVNAALPSNLQASVVAKANAQGQSPSVAPTRYGGYLMTDAKHINPVTGQPLKFKGGYFEWKARFPDFNGSNAKGLFPALWLYASDGSADTLGKGRAEIDVAEMFQLAAGNVFTRTLHWITTAGT